MANIKRRGAHGSEVRARIVEAASEIIAEEGFVAISAPRLADHTGLNRPLIYYYFDDMDQIRLAAVRHAYDSTKNSALSDIQTENPADVLWKIFELSSAPLSELLNYSLRGEPFRLLLSEIMDDLRSTFTQALKPCVEQNVVTKQLGAAGLAFLIQTVSTALANERRLGLEAGHHEVRQFFMTTLGINAAGEMQASSARSAPRSDP